MEAQKKICPECNGNGKVGGLFSKSTCNTCKGKGYIVNPISLSQAERSRIGIEYYNVGVILREQGEHRKAISQFNLAIEYDSSLYKAYLGRLFSANEIKDLYAACNYGDIITDIFPLDANARYFKSAAYLARSSKQDGIDGQISDLRIALREMELAIEYKCQFKNTQESYRVIRDSLKECEIARQQGVTYILLGSKE